MPTYSTPANSTSYNSTSPASPPAPIYTGAAAMNMVGSASALIVALAAGLML